MRALLALILAAVLVAVWGVRIVTAPRPLPAEVLAALPEGDAAAGERIFWAGGCASCHAAPGAKGDDKLLLGGGLRLASPFGTFVAPNVSPHPADGIGAWSVADFANAMLTGTSPAGEHYYPAFPYTSYARMTAGDVADLFVFMKTLPAVAGVAPDHELSFPFTVRRGLGLWKRLHLDPEPVVALAGASELERRGQYLVEGPGHCGECHSPRNLIGGTDTARWLAGAPAATGEGFVPNITGGPGGIGGWSAADIAYYLESGFTPDYDSVGGEMVAVQENMARLPDEDRQAIAAYLKAVPAMAAAR
ncbi:cytochrome c [Polymorphum gilvum]|uniref:Gluconate 2-dehydrogenase (Acceptor) n=1 Tax=Polymorphum gilvum (strain LMG 25793 / CGMCC 1.9160 / SL003B-26A1) TaxID=991905 RepID=F2IV65_POLGS|nr:cytochrome c [Polymorphum gilvum]ADZ71396.1 Gluconate 2-dehydrogenase (Acceptor) [Polymorphum gilvum SL003B-26A1]